MIIVLSFTLFRCSSIQNGKIWQVNSKDSVLIKGYSDSTYDREKKRNSSPLDQVNPLKFVLSGTIFLYQEVLSSQDGNSCQFRPSCSHYGAEAIKKYQLLGIFMTADRLIRCNPYAHNMYHPIENSNYIFDPLIKNKNINLKN